MTLEYITLKCKKCGKYMKQNKKNRIENSGVYAFDCDCGEHAISTKNNISFSIKRRQPVIKK